MSYSQAKRPAAEVRRRVQDATPVIQPRTPREEAEAEIAGYIAQMTTEMMEMAARARLDLLSYLLSIARTEAEVVARRGFTDAP